jgi:hypothetical protein
MRSFSRCDSVDMVKGYMFLLLAAVIVAPAYASFEEPGTVVVSFREIFLSHVDGATVVNVSAAVEGPCALVDYCSLDVLVDGVIMYGECWSDIPDLCEANPGVVAPATIGVHTVLALESEHTIGFRCYARDALGDSATAEWGPYPWGPDPAVGDGPRLSAGVSVEVGGIKAWYSAGCPSGVQAVEETVLVNGLVGYSCSGGSGSSPPPSLEVNRSLALALGEGDEAQLQVLAVSGSGARTMMLVSASRAETRVGAAYPVRVLVRGQGETVPPEDSYSVPAGETMLVEARPLGGSVFLYWVVNGVVRGCDAALPLSVDGETEVEAVFTEAGSGSALRLLEGVEPGPTPWIEAPPGMVKLTVMSQPIGEDNITLCPAPGVYLADAGYEVEVRCLSANRDWVFREWCIGRGGGGATRVPGRGRENAVTVMLSCDTVVTACHSQSLR